MKKWERMAVNLSRDLSAHFEPRIKKLEAQYGDIIQLRAAVGALTDQFKGLSQVVDRLYKIEQLRCAKLLSERAKTTSRPHRCDRPECTICHGGPQHAPRKKKR